MNVVVLMAGRGERFAVAGYPQPKWAVVEPISGMSLVGLSIGALSRVAPRGSRWAFVVQRSDLGRASLRDALAGTAIHVDEAKVIGMREVHAGPLATLAAAAPELALKRGAPLLLQVCDTYLPVGEADLALDAKHDGLVFCFDHDAANLCHVALGKDGRVIRLYEKSGPLLGIASSGAFLFRDADQLMRQAREVLSTPPPAGRREHYVSDVVNRMLASGLTFSPRIVARSSPVGTPDELSRFSRAAAAVAT